MSKLHRNWHDNRADPKEHTFDFRYRKRSPRRDGGATDLLSKLIGLAPEVKKLPPWLLWSINFLLIFLGVYLLAKYRTRHSILVRPDILRLNRDNIEHLVGRTDDIDNLLQQCLGKRVVFLEGESGSGKSALVRSGLCPRLIEEKSTLPLLLPEFWVDDWERSPFNALRMVIGKNKFMSGKSAEDPAHIKSTNTNSGSAFNEISRQIEYLFDKFGVTPLVIFDQFDDYQARCRPLFLPHNTWLSPNSLRQSNPFWELIASLLEKEKVRCLFVARSDTAAGLSAVQFLGPVQPIRLDRVPSTYIYELLTRLTTNVEPPTIINPEFGWTRLRERIVRDISQQDVILPQQLKILLNGIRGLTRLNIAHYERAGGASGIEALYVQQQIAGTARKTGINTTSLRALLIDLVDPDIASKTRSRSEALLRQAMQKEDGAIVEPQAAHNALVELERGEMIRGITDAERGFNAYRLDHDYLTRGVLLAERQANRLHYLVEDGARVFNEAESFLKKWKALLPLTAQALLAWARFRGTFRFGNYRNYILLSGIKIAILLLVLGAVFVAGREIIIWRKTQETVITAENIWLRFDLSSDGDYLEAAWALASSKDISLKQVFVEQMLNSQEYAERFLHKPDNFLQAVIGINPDIRLKMQITARRLMANARDDLRRRCALYLLLYTNPDALSTSNFLEALSPAGAIRDLALSKLQDRARAGRLDEPRHMTQELMTEMIHEDGSMLANRLADVIRILASRLSSEDDLAFARESARKVEGQRIPEDGWLLIFGIFAAQLSPTKMLEFLEPISRTLPLLTDREFESVNKTFLALAPQLQSDEVRKIVRIMLYSVTDSNDVDFRSGELLPLLSSLSVKLSVDHVIDTYHTINDLIKNITEREPIGRRQKIDLLVMFQKNLLDLVPAERQLSLAEEAFNVVTHADSLALSSNFSAVLRYASLKVGVVNVNRMIKASTDLIVAAKSHDRLTGPLKAFATLIPLVGDEDVEKLSQPVVDLIIRTTDPFSLADLTSPFAALLPRLKPEKAEVIAGSVVRTINYANSGFELLGMVGAYQALEPNERKSIARWILNAVVEKVAMSKYREHRETFSTVAAVLAPDLGPNEATTLASKLISIVNSTSDPDDVAHIADSFWQIVDQMDKEPKEILLNAISQNNGFNRAVLESVNVPIFFLQSATAIKICDSSIDALLRPGFTYDKDRILLKLSMALRKIEVDDVELLTKKVMHYASMSADREQSWERIFDILAILLPSLPSKTAALHSETLAREVIRAVTSTRTLGIVGYFGDHDIPLTEADALTLARVASEEMKTKKLIDEKVASGFVKITSRLPQATQLEILASVLKYPNATGELRQALISTIRIVKGDQPSDNVADIWPIIEWLQEQPGIDVFAPPQRGFGLS